MMSYLFVHPCRAPNNPEETFNIRISIGYLPLLARICVHDLPYLPFGHAGDVR